MTSAFIHLHLHSEFSIVDGMVRPAELVAKAAELGMPAVAMTDQNNMFALVKFYRAAEKAGIKPIIGADLLIENPEDRANPDQIILLCQDRTGYLNLCRLISRAWQEGQDHHQAMIKRYWLEGQTDGLIALSGGRGGDIGHALLNGHPDRAEALLASWMELFPQRFYIEIQRIGNRNDERYNQPAIHLASRLGCPVVASNNVRFIKQEDFHAHEARVCIHDGELLGDPRRNSRYTEEQYFKSPDAMLLLFKDIPEALENSVEIARRCNLKMDFGNYVLPAFPVPEGETEAQYIEELAIAGLADRLERHGLAEGLTEKDYSDRLQVELAVINEMGFPGYFLIVADFIRWAKKKHIPVGPGRGSGAGSVVAWALLITDLDPLKYELLFERFLNPERLSMPDFDIDFCMDQRERVIDYVAETYGRDQVSQIITFGTMAAKAAIRDCGRVLGHGYGFVDSIAKLIPMTIGIKIKEAMKEEPQLRLRYEQEEDTRGVIDLALSLEGLTRNAGKHAGGVVIAPSALTDFTPLYCETDGESIVTQFDKDDVETIGLVKFDFLGLRTLTIIDWAVKAINLRHVQEGKQAIEIESLPLEDNKTFKLLKAHDTTAVFQLESRGMKDLIRRLQPDSFEDIIALVALFRPGPLESGMVGDYVERKHGLAATTFPDPRLEPILAPTHGVILYQEQVMQIAQELAGYSLGAADILRRAMGKKKPEEMAKQRLVFVEGSSRRELSESKANFIFDQMETFAGYGFNKSHSAAYALISYQTAWLKAHYPAEFLAATLSADMDNTDKVAILIEDCKHSKIEIEPPDVNHSEWQFHAVSPGTMRYGLGAIKGVGHAVVEAIVNEREEHGDYPNLQEFCQRLDLNKVNKRAVDILVRSGALDSLDPDKNRARLRVMMPDAMLAAEQKQRDAEAGQVDMFGNALGGTASTTADDPGSKLLDIPEWPEDQRLRGERETLGIYLSGHPMDRWRDDLNNFISCQLYDLTNKIPEAPEDAQQARRQPGIEMVLSGLVVGVRKRGKQAFVGLDDGTGKVEVALYDESWVLYADRFIKDEIVVIEGPVKADNFSGGYRMVGNRVMTLPEARSNYAKAVAINIKGPVTNLVYQLQNTFAPYQDGNTEVIINYHNQRASARFHLDKEWKVKACDEVIAALNDLDSITNARLLF
ncbi:MAG: DNA polymerase III subunit alpha [Proteobacteria bacterium]|nr:DNA polymerase III subunit alpha [Pseudomonadota bacterium]